MIRKYIKNRCNQELRDLWQESIKWDQDGHLPMDAIVRKHIRLAVPHMADSMIIALIRDTFAETWRECAVRGIKVKG